jgi:hypothetical protein
MTELVSAQDLFKGRHFDQEIIVLCVRWHLTFKLSSRDLVQMMAERGVAVALLRQRVNSLRLGAMGHRSLRYPLRVSDANLRDDDRPCGNSGRLQ